MNFTLRGQRGEEYLRETAGDKLLIGVDLGVDLGVDPAERSPAGLVNLWLKTFSFPSGTEHRNSNETKDKFAIFCLIFAVQKINVIFHLRFLNRLFRSKRKCSATTSLLVVLGK